MLKPGWLGRATEAGGGLSPGGPPRTRSPAPPRLGVWSGVAADATAGLVATITAVRNPARAVTVAPRAARVRRSRFMEISLVSATGECGFIVRKTAGQPPDRAGQCRQSGGCPSGR